MNLTPKSAVYQMELKQLIDGNYFDDQLIVSSFQMWL